MPSNKNLMNKITKSFKFLHSFFNCTQKFGISGALKVKLFYRFSPNKQFKIHLKNFDHSFIFRSNGDIGAVMHFVFPNYYLSESESCKIKTIIDLGANIGSETIRFAFNYPDARIISVEAQYQNFQMLKNNIEVNNLTNVVLYNRAVYHEDNVKLNISNFGSGSNKNEGF